MQKLLKKAGLIIAGCRSQAGSFLNRLHLDTALDIFSQLRSLIWIPPAAVWVINLAFTLFPVINTLNWQIMHMILFLILAADLAACFVVNRFLFYLTSARTDLDRQKKTDALWSVQKQSDLQASIIEGAVAALPFTFTVLPYLNFLRLHPTAAGWSVKMTDEMAGNPIIIRLAVMSVPVVITWYFYYRQQRTVQPSAPYITDWMGTFLYVNKNLHKLLYNRNKDKEEPSFSLREAVKKLSALIKYVLKTGELPDTGNTELADPEPYLTIGTSIFTGDTVEQTPTTRKQNSIFYGPIGAGKTSTVFRPQIKQDIDRYLRFIRDYPDISQKPGFLKEKGNVATNYLNGIAVVETSNDLCRSIYDMAVQLGVPKKKIVWLDPTNPRTPSLNLLRGPVDTVVETVTNIISGVKKGNNDFFANAERNHLKNMIYLLKLSSVMENKVATFTDLIQLYDDIYLVHEKMGYLNAYVSALKTEVTEVKEKLKNDPDNEDLQFSLKEIEGKYNIAYSTNKFFQNNIIEDSYGKNVKTVSEGPHRGEAVLIDKQSVNIQGLRNTLDDLNKNLLVRRVLFRDSGDFNLDDFLHNGGILLCNTAKAELQDALAGMLGQMYLQSFFAAAFRRVPDVEPLFALYLDEFPDFVSESFKSAIAQARKYNISCTVCAQSPSQLSYDFGDKFYNTLMSNMLTRGVFGDLGAQDARLLEPFFGEHSEMQESVSEQDIDLSAGVDNNRRSFNQRRVTVPNLPASAMMALPKFTLAIRTPGPQNSIMFDEIKTKFLDKKEIALDPNIFYMNSDRDRESYEYMVNNTVHGNPDFDDVDKDIISGVKNGKYPARLGYGGSEHTGKSARDLEDEDLNRIHSERQKKMRDSRKHDDDGDNQILFADDDLAAMLGENTGNDNDKETENLEDDSGSEESGDLSESEIPEDEPPEDDLPDEEPDDFDDIPDGSDFPSDDTDYDENIGSEENDDTDPFKGWDNAAETARNATHPDGPHGGAENRKYGNDIQTETEPEKPRNGDLPEKGEQDMLVQKGDKLFETKKDRKAMEKIKNRMDEDHYAELQDNVKRSVEKEINQIIHAGISTEEKAEKLRKYLEDKSDMFEVVFGAERTEKLIEEVNSLIVRMKNTAESERTDSMSDTSHNAEQHGGSEPEEESGDQLSDDLMNMYESMSGPDIDATLRKIQRENNIPGYDGSDDSFTSEDYEN